ncbi:histidinol dehydrogenase [Candidatus Obscuribacterales bacterium]|nr:histidinol dehydrogenase [Candidatus Obscuribacterales bacterium]
MIRVFQKSDAYKFIAQLTGTGDPKNASPSTMGDGRVEIGEVSAPDKINGNCNQKTDETETDTQRSIESAVRDIIATVRRDGDAGVQHIARQLGDAAPFRLSADAIEKALCETDSATKNILQIAAGRIRNFGKAIVDSVTPVTLDCGEFQTGIDYRPVRRVACYVPAGRYPLPSTALMTAVTARVAGVDEVVIVSPQLKTEIVAAGTMAGVTEFYQIGGAQAVAAMTFGTETIDAVDMIVGPGNAYVTEAKRQLQGTVGIDMLAGPSEICIIADDTANPEWLSLDLLSQAEHDPDARAYLLTDSLAIANEVAELVERDVKKLKLPAFLKESLGASAVIVLNDIDDCIDAANKIAPEHLLLAVDNPELLKSKLTSYGALFMGHGCTVAFGDYMAGPNHTLPTNRSAKFQGCLSPLTFLRPQSWIKVATTARNLANETADFANIEGLTAHAAAASARTKQTSPSS